MKKHFIVWLSIWLSICLALEFSSKPSIQVKQPLELIVKKKHRASRSAKRKVLYTDACLYHDWFGEISCGEVNRAVTEAAREFGLNELRFRRSVACESGFNPYAENGQYKGTNQQGNWFRSTYVSKFNQKIDPDIENGSPTYVWQNPFHNARLAAFVISGEGSNREDYGQFDCKG